MYLHADLYIEVSAPAPLHPDVKAANRDMSPGPSPGIRCNSRVDNFSHCCAVENQHILFSEDDASFKIVTCTVPSAF